MVNQASSSTYPGAIVTFHAPSVGRTFERVFRDASLSDTHSAIKKKLGLPGNTAIRLARVENGRMIDLEDDDDFDVFHALAHQQSRLEVSIAIGDFGFEPVQRVDEPTMGNAVAKKKKRKRMSLSDSLSRPNSPIITNGTSLRTDQGSASPGQGAMNAPDASVTSSEPAKKKRKRSKVEAPQADGEQSNVQPAPSLEKKHLMPAGRTNLIGRPAKPRKGTQPERSIIETAISSTEADSPTLPKKEKKAKERKDKPSGAPQVNEAPVASTSRLLAPVIPTVSKTTEEVVSDTQESTKAVKRKRKHKPEGESNALPATGTEPTAVDTDLPSVTSPAKPKRKKAKRVFDVDDVPVPINDVSEDRLAASSSREQRVNSPQSVLNGQLQETIGAPPAKPKRKKVKVPTDAEVLRPPSNVDPNVQTLSTTDMLESSKAEKQKRKKGKQPSVDAEAAPTPVPEVDAAVVLADSDAVENRKEKRKKRPVEEAVATEDARAPLAVVFAEGVDDSAAPAEKIDKGAKKEKKRKKGAESQAEASHQDTTHNPDDQPVSKPTEELVQSGLRSNVKGKATQKKAESSSTKPIGDKQPRTSIALSDPDLWASLKAAADVIMAKRDTDAAANRVSKSSKDSSRSRVETQATADHAEVTNSREKSKKSKRGKSGLSAVGAGDTQAPNLVEPEPSTSPSPADPGEHITILSSSSEQEQPEDESVLVKSPVIPTGSEIAEVPIEGRDEGSSNESESDDEGSEDESGDERDDERAPPTLNLSLDISATDIDALLRGPVTRKSLLAELPSDSSEDEDDDKVADDVPDDEEEKLDKQFRRLSQRLQRDELSSDEETDHSGSDNEADMTVSMPKPNLRRRWAAATPFRRMSDIASQTLFASQSINDSMSFSSTPAPKQSSLATPAGEGESDSDDDEDSDDSNAANRSHIPRDRMAGAGVQKKKSGLLAFAK
ncbi:predicted protein [Postia placenta Mad-698-R]|uniref:Uncharacterized protein n=1 Tax=Postia placenta MAD-698-R-SB12 TaxID=670580 RepID=A0A1X6NDR4_9APHY|nr:hypothetical protein POSPLADRAFT_1132511 [Postia placenta MAD-698-R-SB12]EED82117.1 predicted protein [Postia placenta Mad-698-R]OSX66714.1 hypothetical protein POSPLADRAFT_1132511 [Postia placenta MAD-698-R-SB12]